MKQNSERKSLGHIIISLMENSRDASSAVQLNNIETVIRLRGWDMAEGEEKGLSTYVIYGRWINLSYEHDQMIAVLNVASMASSAAWVVYLGFQVRRLLEDTISELWEQLILWR